jgi:hypothetical protein
LQTSRGRARISRRDPARGGFQMIGYDRNKLNVFRIG